MKSKKGITLIALIITVIVMLILAGVSINAIVGDNGIITNAQNANFQTQKAILQEYIDNFYVENYAAFKESVNKATTLQSIEESKNWIYKGKMGYVLDDSGYIHYFLVIENFPDAVKSEINVGLGTKTYKDYVDCKDVWGITEDLKVYYCKDGKDSMDGATVADLGQENGGDLIFAAGTPWSKIASGNDETNTIKRNVRSLQKVEITGDSGINNLNELYNFTNAKELILKDLTLRNLDGIEYCTTIYRIYFIRCNVENYSKLCEIADQIQYLFFEDVGDLEISKVCDLSVGIAGKDFLNLAYFGIYGEVHWQIDYRYDDESNNDLSDSQRHSSFSNIALLSKLSKITKERINNLFLNNNSLQNIDNLYEFSGVTRLRIEANYLKNLNGIYHIFYDSSGKVESTKGMQNLIYLHAHSNYLGVDEDSTSLDPNNDAISVLANTEYDSKTGKYTFTSRFKNLEKVALTRNNIKNLNYLSNNENSLAVLTIKANANLNLESGIQSILPIIEKTNFELSCDQYVQDYIMNNSKKANTLSLNGKTMTADTFIETLNGRTNYLYKLDLGNLTLTNNGVKLTTTTTPSFDSVISTALTPLTNLISIHFGGDTYLTSLSFLSGNTSLKQIVLTGTGVTDLSVLADNCPNLWGVVIDNPSIVVANEPDEDGKAEITAVERLFNKTYDNFPYGSSFVFYVATPGVVLRNTALIAQLSKSTNITKFRSGFYELGQVLGNSEVVYDLRNTRITEFWYRNSGSSNGDKFLFPTTLEKASLSNCYTNNAYRFDNSNLATLSNLWNMSGDNCNWDVFWTMASGVPSLQRIDYYNSVGYSSQSLSSYINGLKKQPITYLAIYFHPPYKIRNTISENQLKFISQISSIETLVLQSSNGITNVDFISSLTNLKKVYVSNTSISSLDFVNSLPLLEVLYADNTLLTVESFNIDNERIFNLDILKNANGRKLKTVSIQNTGISTSDINSSGIKNSPYSWTSFLP